MSKNFLEYLKNKYPDDKTDIKEIIIDAYQIKEFSQKEKEYLQKFKKINLFSLNMTQLISLDNLPHFPILSEIELSDNHINGEELYKLTIYIHIKKISLANNNIKNYEDIKCFNTFRNLNFLDLSENPINNINNYRKKLFDLLPTLVFLDMQDKEGKSYSKFEE